MDFPSYTPEGARDHAQHFLSHYEPALIECEKRLSEIQNCENELLRSGLDTETIELQLVKLRQCKTEEIRHRDSLARDIGEH
jgi:hypothetical protein